VGAESEPGINAINRNVILCIALSASIFGIFWTPAFREREKDFLVNRLHFRSIVRLVILRVVTRREGGDVNEEAKALQHLLGS
jgi:hypothetical protein